MILKPTPPPYDPLEWAKLPFGEKSRMVCAAWAMQGYGAPIAVYLLYALKLFGYVAGWVFFCGFTPGLGGWNNIGVWCFEPVAFQKAILWSILFEGLGLGCGSGPLTGRYLPPLGGALYFLRPGTTKLPVFEGAKVIGGMRRTWLDVSLYAANQGLLIWALISAQPDYRVMVAIAALLPVLGVLDETLFLAARGEHYWTTLMVFVLAPSGWVAGAKWVQIALWFWAGVSKLNHHFPSVVGVMNSNSPIMRFAFVRRRMYRRYPEDLAPSGLAVAMGHFGTLLELTVPIVLALGDGGIVTMIGLVMMIALHTFIVSNVPMGVPIEWNFLVVYGAFFLFWRHAAVSLWDIEVAAGIVVLVMCFVVPLAGNLWPGRVPFLLAMRYYAGNWAYSIWLFRHDSHRKLDRLTKTAPWIYDQLARFYDRGTCVGIVGKVIAFRLMHLHGRALSALIPRAVERFEDYEWIDGELVAGMVLGWNFGDGHLHREQLLRAVQAQCGFEEGELRCIMVESQPMGRPTLHYRILDARTGLLEEGQASIPELRRRQPWQ